MDKQRIIATVNPKKKKTNRKEAAAKLREESFNQAYQKNKAEETKDEKTQPEQAIEQPQLISEATEETVVANTSVGASESAQNESSSYTKDSTPEPKTKAGRGVKKTKKKEGVGEVVYATITVHQNVSKAVKLASTMMEANKLDFTTDAVRYYIKHLKKTGQLPDMPALDL